MSAGEDSKCALTMPSLQFSKETVDTILDDEFEDDLRHLDSSLLDCYLSFHSSESSSFQPGGNDGAWSRPISRPKRDRKPKSTNDFYYY